MTHNAIEKIVSSESKVHNFTQTETFLLDIEFELCYILPVLPLREKTERSCGEQNWFYSAVSSENAKVIRKAALNGIRLGVFCLRAFLVLAYLGRACDGVRLFCCHEL